MITIITPTYNREHTLTKAYNSLKNQTNKDFVWLIVDDGSKDNTKDLVQKFQNENQINIQYYYKKNGGKHTALNYGIKKVKSDYILILDSDDELLPDAIELVSSKWQKYKSREDIACISFLKAYPNHEVIGKSYEEEEVISNHIDFRYNRDLLGDMCEVFRSSVLKKYPFPVFDKEKFLSEAIIWNSIALKYDTVYVNKIIYLADYLTDGLSKSFFKLVYRNPIGASENSNMFLIKEFKIKIRVKNAILYDCYCLLANKSIKEIINKSNSKFLSLLFLPLGYLFYIILKFSFKNK